MPVFRFSGRSYNSSSVIKGERFANSKQAVAALLREEHILPITISEKPAQFNLSWATRITAKELALFTRQFSVMLDAGLPLVECLDILTEQQENKAFQAILKQVRGDVEAGATLNEALSKHPKVFDRLFVNMVAAGEVGGVLDEVLKRLSQFAEKAVKLKRAVVSAAVYPAIVIAVAVIIVFIIMVWVVPVFSTLFESLNAPLPLPTRIVMKSSSVMAQFSIPIIVAVVLGAVGFRYLYRTEKGRHLIDQGTLRIPIVGVVLKKIAISRFARTLSTLLVSGIPILEGLDITAGTAGNVIIHNSILRARQEVEEGKSLAEPLQKLSIFPSMVTQVVAVGEKTGQLDQMLEKLAEYYEDEADTAISNMLTMLEPLMIVFLGGIIGGIVVSMYLPIFTLIGRLSSGV